MILDFGSFSRRWVLATLSALREDGRDISQTEQGEQGQRGDGRRQTDHQPSAVSERPKDSASLQEIPMIVNALVSTE